eukprot:TRINITY_DN2606_c0_g1_i1.p1 TRINITY_DN2606_c0_g1~~TRINITY_DN2606_c0_g1_i1.p1  ORF type:complete len:539 (-),score=9.53 TRINITY_DN2606_c0_g1_i1:249-1865(-)
MENMQAGSPSSFWWMLAIPAAPVPLTLEGVSGATIAAIAVAMLTCIILLSWTAKGGPAWWGYKKSMGGPRGVPVIGSMLAMKGLAHRNLDALSRQCGGGQLIDMMAFSMGTTRAIVCSTVQHAKELLNSAAFADRPPKEAATLLMFERAMGFGPSSDYWRHLRRLAATHLFCPRRVLAAEPLRRQLSTTLVSHMSSLSFVDEGIRVRDVVQRVSLQNIMGCLFGRTFDSSSERWGEVAEMVKEGYDLLGILNYSDHFPLLSFLDLQGVRKRSKKLLPKVHGFVEDVIRQHKACPPASSDDSDFVDVLLSLEGSDKLQDSDMVAVLWEMVFRGADTVAIVLEWILARLVMHQDIQERLHKEIDKVVGNSRAVAESDIPKLSYMQAVVKEVLRMHPPGPLLSWARLAIHDVQIGGHFIPAGTTAMVNMWAITHDEKVWKDPESFNPERFLSDAYDVNILGNDLRLAPFGSGRRVCPGRALGMHTVHVWLANLLHHFKWLPVAEHPVNLSELLKLSCEMKYPLYAKPVKKSGNDITDFTVA